MHSLLSAARRRVGVTQVGVLSVRQLQCLYWAQEGKSATDIGQLIGISGRTVERHLFNACHALGVRTRVQAVVKARDLHLLASVGGSPERPASAWTFRR